MMRRVLIALVVLLAADLASAVEPGEMLKDPALEARARAISQEIRCLVCQNQAAMPAKTRAGNRKTRRRVIAPPRPGRAPAGVPPRDSADR